MPQEAERSPVLETLAAMNAVALEECNLPADALLHVRIAALAATDAPPISYLLHIGPAVDAGVTIEQVQGILVAIAPIVGSARVAQAAINIAEALGFAIAVSEGAIDSQ